MKKEEIVRCDLCNTNLSSRRDGSPPKKYLFIPYRDPKFLHLTSICICEKCYYRFPHDLQREIRNVADNQNNFELADILMTAFKTVQSQSNADFNKNFCILSYNKRTKSAEFKRFNLMSGVLEYVIGVEKETLCKVYENGNLVAPDQIDKDLRRYRLRFNLVEKKSDLVY